MIRVFAVPRSIAMSLVKKSKNAMYVLFPCLKLKSSEVTDSAPVKLHLIYQINMYRFKNVSFLRACTYFIDEEVGADLEGS
jgi:hypothetical protein